MIGNDLPLGMSRKGIEGSHRWFVGVIPSFLAENQQVESHSVNNDVRVVVGSLLMLTRDSPQGSSQHAFESPCSSEG